MYILDMEFELGDSQLKTVNLLIGLNESDFTYGWNGYKVAYEIVCFFSN